MSLNKPELDSVEQAQKMDNAEDFRTALASMKGKKASGRSIAFSILGLIPFFNKFIASASGAGNAITRMVEVQGVVNHATQTASSAFQYLKLGTAAIDFLRIPAIYIGALATKQKVPFTFSRNAKFLYSAVILGLAITAVAFPPAAPVIALVVAIASLGQSVVSMARFYSKRHELQDNYTKLEQTVADKKKEANVSIAELETLEKEAATLSAELARLENTVTTLGSNIPVALQEKFTAKQADIFDKIVAKKDQITKQLSNLQVLYNEQEQSEQKLEKMGSPVVLDVKLKRLDMELAEQDKKIRELNEKIREFNDQITNFKTPTTIAEEARQQALQQLLVATEKELEQHKNERNVLEVTKADYTQRLTKLEVIGNSKGQRVDFVQ